MYKRTWTRFTLEQTLHKWDPTTYILYLDKSHFCKKVGQRFCTWIFKINIKCNKRFCQMLINLRNYLPKLQKKTLYKSIDTNKQTKKCFELHTLCFLWCEMYCKPGTRVPVPVANWGPKYREFVKYWLRNKGIGYWILDNFLVLLQL